MPHHFAEIAFTPTVKKVQEEMGSRSSYSRMESAPAQVNYRLTEAEAGFIAGRNSFYMATVSETGWPYIQHRGGPTGFVRVLDESTIGFADFRGN
ncbi:MAG: pyridoxamine 5-phosphate oxidase, partial [Alphaproteobacteria bacterium HGW-Alphaproteobacteria-11]